MAQAEQTVLYFDVAEDTANGYIDIAAALTAANRKQYHQVTGKGKALAFSGRITAIKGETTLLAAQNTFCTSNAVNMTCAGHSAQLRHAGIKKGDLSTYGKRCRFALENGSYIEDTVNFPESDEGGFVISKEHLTPLVKPGGVAYFPAAGYVSSDGKRIHYSDPGVVPIQLDEITANQITTVVTQSAAGAEEEEVLVLLGAATTAGEFNVIENYRSGRVSSPDVDVASTIPDGDMATLFSVAEEASDEIAAGVETFMDYKPFMTDEATTAKFDDLTEVSKVSAATSATEQYPMTSAGFTAPLGLLKIDSSDENQFRLDIDVIYEM